MTVIKDIRIALTFLTVLPVGTPSGEDFVDRLSRAGLYFPVVGFVIGLIVAAMYRVFAFLPSAVVAWMLVLLSLFMSGGLHLDGLADTGDGLLAVADTQKRLEIMSDSRVGTFGLAAVVMILAGLQLGYREVMHLDNPATWVLLAPAVSRWGMLPPMLYFGSVRREKAGLADSVTEGFSKYHLLGALVITVLPVWWLTRWPGVLFWGVTSAVAMAAGAWMNSKLGGLTGDTLGALQMISELSFIFCAAFAPLVVGFV